MTTAEKKRKASITGVALSLPIEVLTSILSRLPVKSILRFYMVCKEWHDLLHHRDFIDAHKAQSKLLCRRNFLDLMIPYKVEMRGGHLTSWGNTYFVLGYSDGLVCVEEKDGRHHICNPATRLSIAVPELPGSRGWIDFSGFNFAMHLNPSTKQCKLARLRRIWTGVCYCEILTLAEGSRSAASSSSSSSSLLHQPWKSVGFFSNPTEYGYGRTIFQLEKDGAVYWVRRRQVTDHDEFIDIYVLDWTTETFTAITPAESIKLLANQHQCALLWDDCLAIGCIINNMLCVWILEDDRRSMKQTWRTEVVALEFLGSLGSEEKENLDLHRKDKDIITFVSRDGGIDIYLYNIVSKEFARSSSSSSKKDSLTSATPYDRFYMPTLESCGGMAPVLQDSTSDWFGNLVEKMTQGLY